MASSFDPNEIDSEHFCSFALSDIGGDEGNSQTGCSLKGENRSEMQGIERPESGFLGQFFSLIQDDLADFHEFPVATIFAKPRPDGNKVALGKFPKSTSAAQYRQDFDGCDGRGKEPIPLQESPSSGRTLFLHISFYQYAGVEIGPASLSHRLSRSCRIALAKRRPRSGLGFQAGRPARLLAGRRNPASSNR